MWKLVLRAETTNLSILLTAGVREVEDDAVKNPASELRYQENSTACINNFVFIQLLFKANSEVV